MSLQEKRGLVCPSYKKMSVYRQCKVMELPRSSYYFKPKGESLFNLQVMSAIDRKFLDCPFYGGRAHDGLSEAGSGLFRWAEAGS